MELQPPPESDSEEEQQEEEEEEEEEEEKEEKKEEQVQVDALQPVVAQLPPLPPPLMALPPVPPSGGKIGREQHRAGVRAVGGKGNGKSYARRHKKQFRGRVGTCKGDVVRMARRAGVKRCSGQLPDYIRGVHREFLERVVKCAIEYSMSARRKTVTLQDVQRALFFTGHRIYAGYSISIDD